MDTNFPQMNHEKTNMNYASDLVPRCRVGKSFRSAKISFLQVQICSQPRRFARAENRFFALRNRDAERPGCIPTQSVGTRSQSFKISPHFVRRNDIRRGAFLSPFRELFVKNLCPFVAKISCGREFHHAE